MRVSEAVEEFYFSKYNSAQKTKEWYKYRLAPFIKWCAENQVEAEHIGQRQVDRFFTWYRSTNPADNTLHGTAQALKTFLFWCERDNILRKAPKVEMPKVSQEIIEVFTPDHIKRLKAACEKEPEPRLVHRDRAILAVLFDTGIRAIELCSLQLSDVHWEDPEDAYLKVHSTKTKKDRMVNIGIETVRLLRKYVNRYRQNDGSEKHVFLNRYGEPLTSNGLLQLFRRLGEWGRIPESEVRCSPHTCRHTMAVNYIQAGGTTKDLSLVLGHANDHITQRIYLRAYTFEQARKKKISVWQQLSGK